MADVRSIGWTFLFFLLSLSRFRSRSTARNKRREKNYEMFMTDSFSDVKRGFVHRRRRRVVPVC